MVRIQSPDTWLAVLFTMVPFYKATTSAGLRWVAFADGVLIRPAPHWSRTWLLCMHCYIKLLSWSTLVYSSEENYAWYLDCKHSALGEINTARISACPSNIILIILNILFWINHPTSGRWPLPRGPLWCDYLPVSGGWPLARGRLHRESDNAQQLRPHMPGGR